jgi:putative phosphonate metabolism protein
MKRYAVYYAPPEDSALHAFGRTWLGRDSITGRPVDPIPVRGMTPERRAQITATPRGYGFHATLKAPFALATERTLEELGLAFEAFAAEQDAFTLEGLQLAEIGGFLALTLCWPSEQFASVAAAALEAFEPFRAPSSPEDLARRGEGQLSGRQRELLARWGYPYVLDEWRFHLTLTNRLDDVERKLVRAALEPLVEPFLRAPVTVDAVSLFVQTSAAEAFKHRANFAFAGTERKRAGYLDHAGEAINPG